MWDVGRRFLGGVMIFAVLFCFSSFTAPAANAGKIKLRSGKIPYRADISPKPATGRAGTAMITADARVARNGLGIAMLQALACSKFIYDMDTDTGTTVPANPSACDDGESGSGPGNTFYYHFWQVGVGTITKAQLKNKSPDGKTVSTRNYNGLSGDFVALNDVRGMIAHGSLEAEAHVKGIDGNRTDVVTAEARVLKLPDFTAGQPSIPADAPVDYPVVISVPVTEIGGDSWGSGVCHLQVDGQDVDFANVWIAPGDTVMCTFTHQFSTLGDHLVSGRIDVDPSFSMLPEYDTSNNQGPSSMLLIRPWNTESVPFSHMLGDARSFRQDGTIFTKFTQEFRLPREGITSSYQQSSTTEAHGISQTLDVTFAYARPEQMTLPVALTFTVSMNGVERYHIDPGLVPLAGGDETFNTSWMYVGPDGNPDESGLFAYISANTYEGLGVRANIQLNHNGLTNYVSWYTFRTWFSTPEYSEYYEDSFGPSPYLFGNGIVDDWGSEIRVDASMTNGTETFSGSLTIPLTSTGPITLNDPAPVCQEFSDEYSDEQGVVFSFHQEECRQHIDYTTETISGRAYVTL